LIATALLALTVLAGTLLAQRASTRRQRSMQADTALVDAERLVERYDRTYADVEQREREFDELSLQLLRRPTAEEEAAADRAERELAQQRRRREGTFYQVLDLLSRAERLGASPEATQPVRARLYLAKFREASLTHDSFSKELYRDLVRDNDPSGLLEAELAARTKISITSEPVGRQRAALSPGRAAQPLRGG